MGRRLRKLIKQMDCEVRRNPLQREICISAIHALRWHYKKTSATKNPPRRVSCRDESIRLATDNDFAFDFNFNAAMRLQARDELFTVLLFADNAWHWLGFAHTECFDLVFSNVFAR
jgi:hypothetical protein